MFGYRAKIHLSLTKAPYTWVDIPSNGDLAARHLLITSAPYLIWIPIGYVLWIVGLIFGFMLLTYNVGTLLVTSYQPEGDLRKIVKQLRIKSASKIES